MTVDRDATQPLEEMSATAPFLAMEFEP